MHGFGLPRTYVDAIMQAGGVPILLPSTEAVRSELFELLDGLVLAGGGDLEPALYSAERHEAVYGVSPERDRFEFELVRRALETPALPVLGICRGMQLMNVLLGGDLEQHLPDRGDGVQHRLAEGKPAHHDVRLETGTVLEEIYGGVLEFKVSSRHHQGVRRLGEKLAPVACAPDGLTEALVFADHPFAIAVQWHPESQLADGSSQHLLFEAFVGRSRSRPLRRSPRNRGSAARRPSQS
jgi:gamma-glutamyl-gamma-aminobutyrate hydrolase PuuD